jgi:peptide subunit release factor 1 (eRF1)
LALFAEGSLGITELTPPFKIKQFRYHCGKRFLVDPLRPLYQETTGTYGVVIVLGEEAKLYSMSQHLRPVLVKTVTKKIPNNHCRGGQSQARIGRLRDEHIQAYMTKMVEAITAAFTTRGKFCIKRLIISGPSFKKQMISGLIKFDKISTLSLSSIEHVIASMGDILNEDSYSDAKENVRELKELMSLAPDRLVFGADVLPAFRAGQLERLFSADCKPFLAARNKTLVVPVVDSMGFLASFGGTIGVRYFAATTA